MKEPTTMAASEFAGVRYRCETSSASPIRGCVITAG